MKTNDYVKYMTEQLVTYVDIPREERKEKRQLKKKHRPPMSYRLFGLIPIAFRFLFNRHK
ncbi:YqzE family protein [Salipaludibacillus agaradhaerens]|jgi:hypothetical protein|uniref:YqzE family protein n=1 Tax=Salipaludibacillus agaradhaerens TaxID=76935 RepID=A0A9Q4B1N7_SALAG|nr:YqzE family protein [Salipaludibacillus agaradhaerens]UJW57536.1 YqzE family protein [Bacillus sp. A116_S68]MCR6096696.1 YqzE family protein [Salipaludibacillus agaradhaerens]MCR6106398.1 YqzE family protein [Salipaludibacillus agaradhaerens]MCR6113745.1 YqzE family protein [Salipaludibacillus agaradhaerens]MCR6118431.1 YqzE family protein [Salipaludibacillus agaradhaerens]